MKKTNNFNLNIGASSILVIVIILTLVSFAGLSVASASADYRLSKRLADRSSAYYNAVSCAYKDLSEIKKESSSSSDNSFEKTYPINENQSLSVIADLNPSDGKSYALKSFNVITISEPEIDNSLSLLLGN